MKPVKVETHDVAALQELGRASSRIIHDLKNQLNGLKLYATFLRKRMERSERPADELETISKLISGLERAAVDMAALVRYSRPVELRRQPQADLLKILEASVDGILVVDESDSYQRLYHTQSGRPLKIIVEKTATGEFDPAALADAFRAITAGALELNQAKDAPLEIYLRQTSEQGQTCAVIDWRNVGRSEIDPFHSFAGSAALRMALAAKIIRAHGGESRRDGPTLQVRLPVATDTWRSAAGDELASRRRVEQIQNRAANGDD
jgi:light-regulated signal transduction histidine kinase (bacteriophytochrome)